MAIEYVKKLVGENPIVEDIYKKVEERVLGELEDKGLELEEVPRRLEYIVEEITIARFNRIGSEGMTAENVGGHSVTYKDEDMFVGYMEDINDYVVNVTGEGRKSGTVYFL